MEAAKIPWREGEAYDEWDSIAEALFQGIVVNNVRLSKEFTEELEMPKYAMMYESVRGFVRIVVEDKSQPGKSFLFFSFETGEKPFDTVRYLAVDADGKVNEREQSTCPFHDARFFFVTDKNEVIEKLDLGEH